MEITRSTAIKLLDKMMQLWACSQPSQVSGLHAECGHHIIHRNNYLFRWDIENIMPLTFEEHYKIHTDWIDYNNLKQAQFYIENNNKSLKGYLLEKGITLDEFIEEKLFDFTKKRYKVVSNDNKPVNNYKKQQQEKARELRREYYKQLKEQYKIKRYN